MYHKNKNNTHPNFYSKTNRQAINTIPYNNIQKTKKNKSSKKIQNIESSQK
jgi:hypothetical protein